jgi:hypothetical protein
LSAKRPSLFEDAISGALGSQVFARFDRAKVLVTYPCGILTLLSENQVDQLFKIRKEWQELNQTLSAKLKAKEIDADQFQAQVNEGRTTYHARKLALLGPELDPKFP